MDTKVCKKCGVEKSLIEFSLHRGECKSCIREYNKKYHKIHKDELSVKKKIYNETHKEQIAAMYHNYYINNMEKKKSYAKEYGQKNKELISEKNKKYREIHKEEIKAYYDAHKEYYKEYKKTPRYKMQQKEYMKNNREHYRELQEKWKLKNYDYYLERRKSSDKKYRDSHKEERKNWIDNNRDIINANKKQYESQKRKNDSLYKLKENVRGTIYASFARKGYKKYSHTYEILGCDYDHFIDHLMKTYKDNYGVEWDGIENIHIDHIIPLSTAKTEEEVIALCYYENLQLLKAKDNLEKHDKLNWKKELKKND